MDIIDIFLNELQKRIDNNDTIINNFENKKNELIEIQNILYAHNTTDKEITLDDLLTFSDEDIKVLVKSIDQNKQDMLYRTFLIYKPIVVTYRNISSKFGEFEAPQYQDALKWLNELLNRVNLYVKEFKNNNEDYIQMLREESAYYKKYYNLFNGDKLVSPIEDLNEFNGLLDKLGFSIHDKGQIKKYIGLNHIELLEDNIIEEQPTVEEKITEDITLQEDSMMEEASNETEEPPKLPIEEKPLAKENEPIIDEALEILQSEKELINSIDEKEFNEYLVQSVVSNNKNTLKYQIVSILLALHREVEKYQNVKGTNKTQQIYISNIDEYIETYKTLKAKNK